MLFVGSINMKVKEKMWDKRGRPRKFQPGEVVEERLRAPDNLLMELRICARMGNRSINDEIIARLLLSLNYHPDVPLINTVDGQHIISLAVKFENCLSDLFGDDGEIELDEGDSNIQPEHLWIWREGECVLLPGKTIGYSMRIPENLAVEIRTMARVHKRSLNDEMLTRLMNTLNYFTERVLDQNEDAQALKVLCIEFEEFFKEKISQTEKSALPWDKNSAL